MRAVQLLLMATVLGLLAGCTTTIAESKRIGTVQSPPDDIAFIWSAAKKPATNHLPAFGAQMIGTPSTQYWENYDSEFAALGNALKAGLVKESGLGRASVVALSPRHTSQQLDAEVRASALQSGVVVMHPERVTSYCLPGCYAFQVRVNYLSPVTRATVWTGVVDLPPKMKHSDSFDPLALEFWAALAKQLGAEGLLPGMAQAPMAPRRAHSRQVPAATGYAPVGDAAAVPVRPEGRDRYLHYLTLPAPKAFVVYRGGGWRFFFGDADAMSKALDRCARDGDTCWLYAVDDQVVWDAVPERRIGNSSQLAPR